MQAPKPSLLHTSSPRLSSYGGAGAALPAQNNIILQRHLELANAYQQHLQEEMSRSWAAGRGDEASPSGKSGSCAENTNTPPMLLLPPERSLTCFAAWEASMQDNLVARLAAVE